MRIPVFSDLHAHAWKDFAYTLPSGRNSRLEHALAVLRRIRRWCRVHRTPLVFFGGDLFHKRHLIPVSTYQPVYEELERFKLAGIQVVALVGNHDQSTADGSLHSTKVLSQVVTLVDTPSTLDLSSVVKHPFHVRCVPYMADKDAFKAALQVDSNSELLLAHGGINGAKTGTLEYQPPEQVDIADVPDTFGFAFFGHYHRRQRLRDRCWYIGSPLQHVRGESADGAKGFLLYDTEKRSFKLRRLPFPAFQTFDLTKAGPIDSWNLRRDAARVRDNFCDVTYSVESGVDDAAVEAFFKSLGATAVQPAAVRQTFKQTARLDVDPTMSHKTLVEKYIEEYGDDLPDRAEALRIALAALEAAS